MKKIVKNVVLSLIVLGMIFTLSGIVSCSVYADDFMTQAGNWWNTGNNIKFINIGGNMLGTLTSIIKVAGTAIISIVTVVLGIKYIMGSVNGKAEVKQQLINLLVACLFFFGWSNISSLLIKGAVYNSTTGVYDNVSQATQLFIFENTTNATQMFGKIFAIAVFFGKIVAIIATMVIGVKYIFSGSEGKASLKQKGPMYIIGILMVFCTLNVLSFISDAITGAF